MTIRTYEYRTYTLASEEAVEAYATVYYPNHEASLQRLFGVTVHGYWKKAGSETHEFCVLMSYPEGSVPDDVRRQYREHPESVVNMPHFDPAVIREVSISILTPAAASPLR